APPELHVGSPQSFSLTLISSMAVPLVSLAAEASTLAVALPFLSSLFASFFFADDFSSALILVFTVPSSCFVVCLMLPPATSVESTLVVAKKVSFFLSSCFFAARSSCRAGKPGWGSPSGGGGGPGVGGVGGVGVVAPLPLSSAV